MTRAPVNIILVFGAACLLGGCLQVLAQRLDQFQVGLAKTQTIAKAAANVGIPYAGETAAGVGALSIVLAVFQRVLMRRLEDDVKVSNLRSSARKQEIKELEAQLADLKANGNGGSSPPPTTTSSGGVLAS